MNTIQQRVCRHIVSGILHGTFAPGAKIPTEQELAATFDTTRMNVHGAVKALEGQQIVERRRRAGTFVRAGLDAGDMQALLSATSSQVHVLMPRNTSAQVHWNDHTVTEIEERLNAGDCQVQFVEMPEDRSAMETCLKGLTNQGSKAVVILPDTGCHELLQSCADVLARAPLDIYLLNRGDLPTDSIRCHMLCLDPFDEGLQVALHIQDGGWQNMVFVHTEGDTPIAWALARREGLRAGLAGCDNLTFNEQVASPDEPWSTVAQYVNGCPQPPLLVAQNDALAAGLIDGAVAAGADVNTQFHVISFDDDPTFRHYNLTTMAPPLSAMAEALSEVVLTGLPIKGGSQLVLRLRSRLVVRGTTVQSPI